jgi:hypothetical protein
VVYLRVYEPLRAFAPGPRQRLERALAAGPLPAFEAGMHEREVWLRTQLSRPPRMLPGDRADGTETIDGPLHVLSIDSADVPGADPSVGTLVCPLDLRTRAAAALVGFLATASPSLVRVALPVGPRAATDAMRSRAQTVVSELGSSAVHVVSSTWTVPLPWFALVDPEGRRLDAKPRPDLRRRVYYRATLRDAIARAARAHAVVLRTIGDNGPVRVLGDTARWLRHFDPESVVELDYGGVVQLMDDDSLLADTSAQDVHAAVDAMEQGDLDEVALRYERLRDFWTPFALYERFG